jgi:predicted nucleic acid-binding Zn finger protein
MAYITKEEIPQLFDDEVLPRLPSRYIPYGYIEGDDMLAIADPRQQRGLEIAATIRLTKKGGVWIVPSSSGKGRYTVCLDDDEPHCSCPDHESRGAKCKHIFAVEYAVSREQNHDGSTTVTETVTVQKTVKRTYPQNWAAYNEAQTHEKERFLDLLHDLCGGLDEPERQGSGRPRLPIKDAIFAACFKVYSTVSGRRFMSDLRHAHAKGYVSRLPHFNSIFNYLENPDVTPTLPRSCTP